MFCNSCYWVTVALFNFVYLLFMLWCVVAQWCNLQMWIEFVQPLQQETKKKHRLCNSLRWSWEGVRFIFLKFCSVISKTIIYYIYAMRSVSAWKPSNIVPSRKNVPKFEPPSPKLKVGKMLMGWIAFARYSPQIYTILWSINGIARLVTPHHSFQLFQWIVAPSLILCEAAFRISVFHIKIFRFFS